MERGDPKGSVNGSVRNGLPSAMAPRTDDGEVVNLKAPHRNPVIQDQSVGVQTQN